MIYTASYIKQINDCSNIQEQQRLYEEYVNCFLAGHEDPKNDIVQIYSNSPFIIQREQKRKCDKYGLIYDPKNPLVVYEATEETGKDIIIKNDELATQKLKQPVQSSDLVLVRATNFLPRYRLVEPVGKHSMPLMDGSFFDDEIQQAGLDTKDYNMAAFVNRSTSHWALNGLVGSHDAGNFEGRNFIIIEPFDEQENNEGLMNIGAADTYFNKPVKLSKRATLLVRLEAYQKACNDPDQAAILSEYNIRIFVGDEDIAVKMFLHEQGYVSEDINKWGFPQTERTPSTKYGLQLEQEMLKIAYSKNNVTYDAIHRSTDSYSQDAKIGHEFMQQRLDRFVKLLYDYSDVNFSEQYLKAFFKSKLYHWGDEKYYKQYYEEYLQQAPELSDVQHMSPKEVFQAIGPERIKEITKIYNAMIFEEHKKARSDKDKQLLEQGILTKEEMLVKTKPTIE